MRGKLKVLVFGGIGLPPDEMAAVLEKAYGPGAGAEIVEMYRHE